MNYREHSAGVPKVKAFMTWMMEHINHPPICNYMDSPKPRRLCATVAFY